MGDYKISSVHDATRHRDKWEHSRMRINCTIKVEHNHRLQFENCSKHLTRVKYNYAHVQRNTVKRLLGSKLYAANYLNSPNKTILEDSGTCAHSRYNINKSCDFLQITWCVGVNDKTSKHNYHYNYCTVHRQPSVQIHELHTNLQFRSCKIRFESSIKKLKLVAKGAQHCI